MRQLTVQYSRDALDLLQAVAADVDLDVDAAEEAAPRAREQGHLGHEDANHAGDANGTLTELRQACLHLPDARPVGPEDGANEGILSPHDREKVLELRHVEDAPL